MKKNVFALSFFTFLVIAAFFYLFSELLSRYKAEDLEKLSVEKTRAAVNVSIPSINKAIESSDDIAMLVNIETLSRLENISSCFILNRNNNVIIHNNPAEWNSERKSPAYDRAVNYDAQLVQQTPDPDHLLFSAPIANDYTLCCIVSIQKAKENAKNWKIRYYTIAATSAFAISFLVYFMAKLLIVLPFRKTKKALEEASADSIKNGKYNEITDLFLKENEKNSQIIKALEENKTDLLAIVRHLAVSYTSGLKAFIILDSDDNIVYAFDSSGKILKEGFKSGQNIVEAASMPELVKAVSEMKDKQREISETLGEMSLKINPVINEDKILAATIKIN